MLAIFDTLYLCSKSKVSLKIVKRKAKPDFSRILL
jgi:hypothetical protein